MLKKTIAIIILIIGLLLIFSPFIKNGIVKYMSGHETIEQYKASDIKKNNEKDATFDFESVQLPSMTSVIKGAANYDKDAVVGSIAVPSVDVNLLVSKEQIQLIYWRVQQPCVLIKSWVRVTIRWQVTICVMNLCCLVL